MLDEGQREANDRRDAMLRQLADPSHDLCHGAGQVSGHVAGDKEARYPCYCTGAASWQAGPEPDLQRLLWARQERESVGS